MSNDIRLVKCDSVKIWTKIQELLIKFGYLQTTFRCGFEKAPYLWMSSQMKKFEMVESNNSYIKDRRDVLVSTGEFIKFIIEDGKSRK